MSSESIMPISTQKIALEQFNAMKTASSAPGQELNKMFFSMMMKSMFDVTGVEKNTSSMTKINQQLYVDVLTQELADNFDVGFSELQFELKQREIK